MTSLESLLSYADQLGKKRFSPMRYIVPNILPEGLTVLAGRPKVGKSWLALDIAIGVAAGCRVMHNATPETPGDVLYLALEDNERRLQARMEMLGGIFPKRLAFATQWPRLDNGGTDLIKQWIDAAEDPRLVVADTLACMRPERTRQEAQYDHDYRTLGELQHFIGSKQMGALFLHHTRKQAADDWADTISGTLGLTGAADTVMVIEKQVLQMRGRDVEDKSLSVIFGKGDCRWQVLADEAETRIDPNVAKIRDILEAADEPLGPKAVQERMGNGAAYDAVKKALERNEGEFVRIRRGAYTTVNKAPVFANVGSL
jgi:AAA domain